MRLQLLRPVTSTRFPSSSWADKSSNSNADISLANANAFNPKISPINRNIINMASVIAISPKLRLANVVGNILQSPILVPDCL